jgi:hypothetical protein
MNNALTRAVFGRKLNQTYTLSEALGMLNDMELIQIGELAELAISKHAGVDLCEKNCPNIDTVTGKQIKHAQTHPERGAMKAFFSINTTAPILLVVSENLTKQQYYFYIPYKEYRHMNANSIAIPFNDDGSPKTSNKWWNHKVNDFNELCALAQ